MVSDCGYFTLLWSVVVPGSVMATTLRKVSQPDAGGIMARVRAGLRPTRAERQEQCQDASLSTAARRVSCGWGRFTQRVRLMITAMVPA